MKRFTGKNADGAVSVTEADLPDALRHLAAFEDALEELAKFIKPCQEAQLQ